MENREWIDPKEDEDRRASPIYPFLLLGSYGLQIFLIFMAPQFWQLFAGGLGLSEIRGSPYSGVVFQIANGLWIGVIGCLLGVSVQFCLRGAVTTGRWIWVPLAALLVYGVS